MRVTLQIPDELYDAYAAHLQPPLNGHASPEEMMIAQLERFKVVSPQDRAVVVCSKERVELEQILSGGTLRDGADLLAKVRRLAAIEIGGVRVDFSPGLLQQLRAYATKNRRSVEQVTQDVVRSMEHQFGNHVG